ncbi:MAG: DUF600 family protein [Clostridia bacterium]|nr:DUF600 family protein [Clostridia bacterium]
MQNGVKKLYGKIQKTLISLIPENWKSIYLYASVINGRNGEMYFYYYPKKIIKSKPINCYEVASKFGIDETKYNRRLKKLYEHIKELNTYAFPRWTNITIIIKNNTFTIEYKYNRLVNSHYNDEERRIIWCYKYLNTPIESLSIKDRALIDTYKEDSDIKPTIYTEFLSSTMHDKDSKSEEQENDIEDNKILNQILKY